MARYIVNDGGTYAEGAEAVDSSTGITEASSLVLLNSSGNLDDTLFPAFTGDITTPGRSVITTLATVNANVGTFGDGTHVAQIIVDAKGRVTGAADVLITGAAPTGSAGGDLSGTFPNPSVVKINGVALGTTTATSGNVLIGSGTQWVSTPISGDLTLDSLGITTLATVNSNVGSFGDASHVTGLTTNAKGLITAASSISIQISESQVTGLVTDLADKQPLDSTLTAFAAFNTNGLLTQTAADTFTGRTLTGTSNKIDVTNGDGVSGNPTVTISPTYVGQSSITTLGTIATGTWQGTTIAETYGGTNQAAYTLGDSLYASAANTLSKLAGNITTAKQYLSQTGTGSVSAAPAWATIVGSDITGSALTKTDDTNVTLTLGGSSSTALLRAASLTLGWTGQLSLARGGTNANLSASNGGVFYSTASAGAILAGTATARQMLLSGASGAPAWSNTTFPSTTIQNQLLWASGANVVSGLTTANSGVLITSSGGVPSIGSTLPTGVQTNITSLGTVVTGVWQGTVVDGTYINYNTTNLKVTSSKLNTIQDIASNSSVQFNDLFISGTAISNLLEVGGTLSTTATSIQDAALIDTNIVPGVNLAQGNALRIYPSVGTTGGKTLTDTIFLHIDSGFDLGGTKTNAYGVVIEALTIGATNNVSLWAKDICYFGSGKQLAINASGVVTAGTWNGGVINPAYGGTGQSSYAIGDLLQASGTTALSKLAAVATGNVLISGGVTTVSSWGKVGLTTHISGTLGVANGGTSLTSGTSGGLLYFSGTTTIASSGALTAGALLFGAGAGAAPTFDSSRLTWDTTNNILAIGGASPYTTAPLYVTAASPTNGIVAHFANSSTGGGGISIGQTGVSSYGIVNTASNELSFYENRYPGGAGTLTFRLAAGGTVGINGSSFGGGVGVMFMANANTVPTSNPSGGGIIYTTAGALKYRGSSGTTTNVGNAEPHCVKCGSDFSLGWDNVRYGGEMIICKVCEADWLNTLRKALLAVATGDSLTLSTLTAILDEDISHVKWNIHREDEYQNIRIPADVGAKMAAEIALLSQEEIITQN